MPLALTLGLLTTLANAAGSYLAIAPRVPRLSMMNALIGVSGGFILSVALLEMVPEALEGGEFIAVTIVGGYLLMYLIEQYFAAHAHEPLERALVPAGAGHDEDGEHALHTEFLHGPRRITRQAAIAAFAGFLAHDFLDGLAIGAGLLAESSVGLLVFLGVLLHEVPAGLSVATLMRAAGSSRLASFLSGVGIGLVTLPGILLPFLVGEISGEFTHVFLGLAAGTFLYISTTVLIPAAGVTRSRSIVFSVVGGAAAFWVTSLLVGEVAQ
jgi:zinc transporter ZupT